MSLGLLIVKKCLLVISCYICVVNEAFVRKAHARMNGCAFLPASNQQHSAEVCTPPSTLQQVHCISCGGKIHCITRSFKFSWETHFQNSSSQQHSLLCGPAGFLSQLKCADQQEIFSQCKLSKFIYLLTSTKL